MSVTLIDIARIAKVSESAVSRALHDHPRISPATRDRIKKIAQELEFEFNSAARSLSTSKSGTIGVIIPNFGTAVSHSYYLDLLITDIRSQLGAAGFDLLIADSQRDGERSNLRRLVLQNKVDGLVLIIGDLKDADRAILRERKVPVVMVNSKPQPMATKSVDEFPSFFTDNVEGGRVAAAHLVDRGCRRLLCLADQASGPEMLDRTQGFVRQAERLGVSVEVVACAADFRATAAFVGSNLEHFRRVDGVFCHTDVMGVATLRALAQAGLGVPAQLKVVGFDDIELGTYSAPELTTVHQPREEIARLACRKLLALLQDEEAEVDHVSVRPELVVRGST